MTRAALVSLRPRQWSKNLLLFAGLIFAAKVGDASRWGEAVLVFVAYCSASSAAYLVNDVRDAEADRLHPVKSARPIARGELAERAAALLAAAVVVFAFVLCALLGWSAVAFLAGFVLLQAAYSFGLKRVVFVDVLTIAALFVVRAAAGADAVDVRISPWLLVCTALLALFLGLAKRRGELVLVHADETPGRAVLDRYSLRLVDRLLAAVTAATVLAYAAYTVTTHTAWLVLTIPFVVFGLARYLVLVHRHELGEEPENVLLRDRWVLGCIAAWAIVSAAILALS